MDPRIGYVWHVKQTFSNMINERIVDLVKIHGGQRRDMLHPRINSLAHGSCHSSTYQTGSHNLLHVGIRRPFSTLLDAFLGVFANILKITQAH